MQDRADVGVGEIALVATGIVALVGVYAAVGAGTWSQEDAPGLGLVGEGTIANGLKTFAVTAATPGATWSDFAMVVDGQEFRYDATLSGLGVYCVQTGSGCVSEEAWRAGALVSPGQEVAFRGSDLAGRTLRVTALDGSTTVWTVPFGT